MEKYVSSLKNEILQNIQKVDKMECGMLQKSKLIIPLLENAFEELKSFVYSYSFKDDSEEIQFFKQIKPQLFSQLIYRNKLYSIEMGMPTGSIDDRKIYLERFLSRIKYFFDTNLDFYKYYRSGSTHLDHLYFIRGKPDIQLPFDCFYFERDGKFSTCCDFKMTKILANEMLATYLNTELVKLAQEENNIDSIYSLSSSEKWTDKKIALCEIIYGIDSLGSVNYGNTDIKVLTSMFSKMFNIDLSDIYHIFLEMRRRKGDRTEYLNRLIKALLHRMDDADNK